MRFIEEDGDVESLYNDRWRKHYAPLCTPQFSPGAATAEDVRVRTSEIARKHGIREFLIQIPDEGGPKQPIEPRVIYDADTLPEEQQ